MTLARISERCNNQSMPRAQIVVTGSCTAKDDKNVVTLHSTVVEDSQGISINSRLVGLLARLGLAIVRLPQ